MLISLRKSLIFAEAFVVSGDEGIEVAAFVVAAYTGNGADALLIALPDKIRDGRSIVDIRQHQFIQAFGFGPGHQILHGKRSVAQAVITMGGEEHGGFD
jgi:hypothetical protein